MNLFARIKKALKEVDWKEEIKNILIEYFILSNIIVIIFLFKDDMDSKIFALAMFMIYIRHHHIGEKVVVEKTSKGTYSKTISKKKYLYLLNLIDPPTILIASFFLANKTDFYLSMLIFVLWFIITDIFRTRKSIHGIYISRWFYTSKININNSKWRLNISDVDHWPSVPHMHATDSRPLKLNIYNGEIRDIKTKKLVETADIKDLGKLWSCEKFKANVVRAREIYIKNNPKYKLDEMPNFKLRNN